MLGVSVLPDENSPSPVASVPSSPVPSRASPAPSAASSAGSFVPTALQELIFEIDFEQSDDEADVDTDEAVTPAVEGCGDEVGTGLFDDSDDEEAARPVRSRLRRGDETSSWHPNPPEAPLRHPKTKHWNRYKKGAPCDYSVVFPIVRLLDVWGEVPHRCYLVQWKGRPLQMSWVWMEQLDKPSTRIMMQQVDEWKASGTSQNFMDWTGEPDTASEAGTCFMDALRSALYYLGEPNLVTMDMWDVFEATRPSTIQFGVKREDVSDFFKHLQRQSVPLNYDHLHKNIFRGSSTNIQILSAFCGSLVPGVYIVSAGQDALGHCFVVVSRGCGKRLLVLDHYDDEQDPPMKVLRLSKQHWVERVKWMTRVELNPGYKCRHGKRKSKTQRKREKRLRQQDQQQ
ncbi:hypothetical protein PHMEG_00032519 [Phytophthora megakarya]|uniref:Uncharacterized protein n=1 Tax=Phytophthora megakarya TaxID=4795 RepID=A0A225UUL6_9STRA|nr:hypothetical protein PHMEG_00032519 [Phytophthora megakarya]